MSLKKLRAISPGELRYRLEMMSVKKIRTALQHRYRDVMAPARFLPKWGVPAASSPAFAAAVARRDWSHAEEALLQYMRARVFDSPPGAQPPRFFIDPRQRRALTDMARRLPHAAEDLVLAERVCAQRFSYLDVETHFPDEIAWHRDPHSGRSWPRKFYTEIKFYGQHDGDQALPGDVKYVWELSRHHHFALLGKAYWLTEDEKFAESVWAQCMSWIRQNPYLWGVNWTSALEVGMRALSWLWAYFFCLHAPSLAPGTHAALLRMLQLHARYINRHLSFYTSPYNHLVGEAAALFMVALLFPEFPEAQQWRERGWKILNEEVEKQFHADGMSVEQAMSYHHFTLGLYLQVFILAQHNGIRVPTALRERLQRALEFCQHSRQPDGLHPMLGDNDDACAFYFAEKRAWDFREYLALGALLFERGDFKSSAGAPAEACLWLLGPDSMQQFEQLPATKPEPGSILLRESGYAILREGSTGRDGQYLIFDCGPQSHGLFANEKVSTAHGHADALNFCLAAFGRPFLVDSGMLTYNGDLGWQNHFRRGQAHNVITVDGKSASQIVGRLGYAHVPTVEPAAFLQREEFTFVEAQFTGFGCQVQHRRGILYRHGRYWLIWDHLDGEGEHVLERWFHFAPDLTVQGGRAQALAQYTTSQKLLLYDMSNVTAPSEILQGGPEPEQGWLAPAYGTKIAAPVLCWRSTLRLPAQFVTLIVPFTAQAPLARCENFGQDAGKEMKPFTLHVQGTDWEDQILISRERGETKISLLP